MDKNLMEPPSATTNASGTILPSYLLLSAGLDMSLLFKLHKAFQFKKNIKCKDK